MTECCIADDKGDELPGYGDEEPGYEETAVRPPPCEMDPSPDDESPDDESPDIDDIPAIDDIDMAD